MTKFLIHHKWYFGFYLLFLLVGGVLLFLVNKGDVLLWINERHGGFGDVFFRYFTWFGDGKLVIGVVILLLIFRFKKGIIAAVATIVCGAAIYLLKRGFDIDRPIRFFEGVDLNVVEGVKMNHHFSFPSGHTAGAFCLFTLLALLFPNRRFQVFCFSMAFLVGISRIYLVQHFFEDVYAGSILGVLIATLSVWFVGGVLSKGKI